MIDEIATETETDRIRHEIYNVLAAIIGHTQLLKLRGEMDVKSSERVEKIELLANRVKELAGQLKN